jgi:4-amino-4-deoxy-L-arabinose transferase-like glycosyltransferase
MGEAEWPAVWQERLLAGFLLLGILARAVRYFLRFPLWEDECFLCVNLMERDYWELLQPLRYHQVAPPLFLWIQRSVVYGLGFHELALRLFPFGCSLVSLFLFRHLAGRVLRGFPLLLAVAVFAAAYPCIRYAAEAKQYASDQLVSLLLLSLALAWWRRPSWKRGLALVGLASVAVALSYPAVFIAGGLSLVLAAFLWVEPRGRGWGVWLAYTAALGTGSALVYIWVACGQSQAELPFMDNYWRQAFPPLTEPFRLLVWLLQTHLGDLLAYPAGGGNFASLPSGILFITGWLVLLRRRQYRWALWCAAPFVLNLAAAAVQRYPYGGHMKFAQHLSPFICLLVGLGGAAWIEVLGRHRQRGLGVLGLAVPAAVGLGSIARDLAYPYKTQSDQRARAFAQWFWPCAEFAGEAVCLKTDLGLEFASRAYQELSWAAMYLCNQKIYSPRHAAGRPPQLARIDANHPLRCVLYHDPEYPCEAQRVARWLHQVQQHLRLVSRERYPLPRLDKRERRLLKVDQVEIFTFVPREKQRPVTWADLQEPPAGAVSPAADFAGKETDKIK